MTLEWEGADGDRAAAIAAAEERARLVARTGGEPLTIANEFSEITVSRVETVFPDPDPSSTRNDHGHGEG